MTFQQDDLFKKDNRFGAAAGFVAEIDGSFPGKAPRSFSRESSTKLPKGSLKFSSEHSLVKGQNKQ